MAGAVEFLGCPGRSSNHLRSRRSRMNRADDPRSGTGIHRSALSRVLAELRRRELVRPEGDRDAATPLGSTIAARLAEAAGAIEGCLVTRDGAVRSAAGGLVDDYRRGRSRSRRGFSHRERAPEGCSYGDGGRGRDRSEAMTETWTDRPAPSTRARAREQP